MELKARLALLIRCAALLLGVAVAGCGEHPEMREHSGTDPNGPSKAAPREAAKAEPPDIRRHEPVGEFECPKSCVGAGFLFTPDSRQLVMFSGDQHTDKGTIDFWEIPGRKLVKKLEEPKMVAAVAFSPDGKRMVTSCWDHKLRIYAGPDWQRKHTFRNDPPRVTAYRLTVLADGKHFVAGNGSYNAPCIWNIENQKSEPLGKQREVLFKDALAASKDGKRVVIGYLAPLAEVWDTARRERVGRIELAKRDGMQGTFTGAAYSPDGKFLATAGFMCDPDRYVVTVWDAATLKKRHEMVVAESEPESLTYTSDGKLLVACVITEPRKPGFVYVWDAATGKTLARFDAGPILSLVELALSPDDRWLVTSTDAGAPRLWDFAAIRRDLQKVNDK